MLANLNLNKITDSSLDGKGTVFSQIKIDILALLSIIFALAFSWSLNRLIYFSAWQYIGLVLISAILFLVIFFYKPLFISDKKISALLVFLDSGALLIFFIMTGWAAILVFLAVFVLLYLANKGGMWTIANNLTISFWRVGYVTLPKAMICLFLIPSVFLPLKYEAQKEEFPLSEKVFGAAIDSSQKMVNIFFPGFEMHNSIESTTRQIVSNKINNSKQAFSPEATELIIKENQKGVYQSMTDWLGIKIDPSKNFTETLYESAKQKYSVQPNEFKSIIFLLGGVFIFLSLAALLFPIRIMVSVIAWIGYECLLAFGFARITTQDVSKEVVKL